MKSKISKEDKFNKRLEKIKSLIKVGPFFSPSFPFQQLIKLEYEKSKKLALKR